MTGFPAFHRKKGLRKGQSIPAPETMEGGSNYGTGPPPSAFAGSGIGADLARVGISAPRLMSSSVFPRFDSNAEQLDEFRERLERLERDKADTKRQLAAIIGTFQIWPEDSDIHTGSDQDPRRTHSDTGGPAYTRLVHPPAHKRLIETKRAAREAYSILDRLEHEWIASHFRDEESSRLLQEIKKAVKDTEQSIDRLESHLRSRTSDIVTERITGLGGMPRGRG